MPRPTCRLRDVTTDDLMDVVQPIADRPWQEWPEEEVTALVSSIRDVCSVDFSKSSKNAALVYKKFLGQWSQFLTFRPDITQKLDPFYVIADLAMAVPPAGFAAAIAAYPPPGPALPGRLAGAGYIWPFQTQSDADHFIGWIQQSSENNLCWPAFMVF